MHNRSQGPAPGSLSRSLQRKPDGLMSSPPVVELFDKLQPIGPDLSKEVVMAGFSFSCRDLILMWRIYLPVPTSNLSGSDKKPPKKKPRLRWFSNTVMYMLNVYHKKVRRCHHPLVSHEQPIYNKTRASCGEPVQVRVPDDWHTIHHSEEREICRGHRLFLRSLWGRKRSRGYNLLCLPATARPACRPWRKRHVAQRALRHSQRDRSGRFWRGL